MPNLPPGQGLAITGGMFGLASGWITLVDLGWPSWQHALGTWGIFVSASILALTAAHWIERGPRLARGLLYLSAVSLLLGLAILFALGVTLLLIYFGVPVAILGAALLGVAASRVAIPPEPAVNRPPAENPPTPGARGRE